MNLHDYETKRIFVRCSKADKELVKEAGNGSAKWDRRSKAWYLPADPLIVKRLINNLPGIGIGETLKEWLEELLARQRKLNDASVNNEPLFEGDKLYPFQRAAVRVLNEAGSLILGDEMGLGKTPIGCSAIKMTGAKKIIVVCPNQVKWSWVEHLNVWTGYSMPYLIEATKAKSSEAIVIYGKHREEQIGKVIKKDSFVVITGYEMMRKHIDILATSEYDLIMYDEAHRLKNRKAMVTQAARELSARSKRNWLLTGTPIRNRPDDLFTLLSIVDPERFSSYWDFVNIHMDYYHEYKHIEITGIADEEAFNSMVSSYMLRRTKEEVMPDLPEKIYTDFRLPLLSEQENIYRAMEEEMLFTIEKEVADGKHLTQIVSAPNTVAMLMRLRQICLSPSLLGENEASSAKIKFLEELLYDLHQQNQQTVIFTYFRRFIPEVEDILSNIGINYGVIEGGQKAETRYKLQRALSMGELDMIIGTAQSMGEGMNLQAATTAVFCDLDWVPANNQQAEDRIHRSGTKYSPNIIRLYHPHTIESDIRSTCKRKTELIKKSIGSAETIRAMMLRKNIPMDFAL